MRDSDELIILACASKEALEPSTMQSVSSVGLDYSLSLERSAVMVLLLGRERVGFMCRDDNINLIE